MTYCNIPVMNPAIITQFHGAFYRAIAYYVTDKKPWYAYFDLAAYNELRDWCNGCANDAKCCKIIISVYSPVTDTFNVLYRFEV